MAASFLQARFDGRDLIIQIHTDTTKLKNGLPDPAFVQTYTFGAPRRNTGETQAAYRTRLRTFADRCIPEARLLAQASVAPPDSAGVVTLAEEGTTF